MENNQACKVNINPKSRTENSARNTVIALTARVFAIVLGFGTRIMFTHTLSEAYVGVNGLFTNILNVLSITDLGINSAIIYGLYQPVSQKNYEKQKALLQIYKRFYRFFAVAIFLIGLLLIPFMDILIKEKPSGENIVLIYLIYLLNCSMSYLLVYKKSLIDAHQLNYIGVLYQTFAIVLQNVLQIIILFTTKNFILFSLAMLACMIINNVSVSAHANKLFPYIKEKNNLILPKEEQLELYQTVKAMVMHKIGNVIVNNTANLLLSAMVGIIAVGIYSNYYLVIGSVRQVLIQMFQGITSSVGNLRVEESKERIVKIFYVTFFICQWLFGWTTICLYGLLTPFVELSFGKQYVFSNVICFVLCLGFYFNGMRQATLVFKDSFGQFWTDRYKAVVEVIINLIVSVVLGYWFGAVGIFMGMIISTLTTSFWVEPYMLFKYNLKEPLKFYFIKYFKYAIITGAAWYITDLMCQIIQGSIWRQLIVRFMICLIVPNIIFLLTNFKSMEWQFLWDKLGKIMNIKMKTESTDE